MVQGRVSSVLQFGLVRDKIVRIARRSRVERDGWRQLDSGRAGGIPCSRILRFVISVDQSVDVVDGVGARLPRTATGYGIAHIDSVRMLLSSGGFWLR